VTRVGVGQTLDTSPSGARQLCAWIISFGPVGGGSDGYMIRVESNARALAGLGFIVHVLEISNRSESSTPWPNVTTHPASPSVVSKRRIFGRVNLLADLRGQVALTAGMFRYRKLLRSADVMLVEGGLLGLAFALAFFGRQRGQLFVFDLITLESALHRDTNGNCTLECKSRRVIWRALELLSTWFSDLAVAGSEEDALGLYGDRVKVVPHAVVVEAPLHDSVEDPYLLGFLGSGHVAPNRQAVDFIATTVLQHPGLESIHCRVIGQDEGYGHGYERVEFVGFMKDPSPALSSVSVGCAPMSGAGGVSTKVLTYLMNGKRTVCTTDASHGIGTPPSGLWVAERPEFAEAVASALDYPWSPAKAQALRDWMSEHHGLRGLELAWQNVLGLRDSSALQRQQ
jgi:hypothetical protein